MENFPLLNSANSRKTSPVSESYNCISWVVEVDNKQYWPDNIPDLDPEWAVEWPEGIPNEETVDAFVAFFQLFGYKLCNGPEFEEGFIKLALFVDHRGVPTHASRQVPHNKKWTSKMGTDGIDIEHDDLISIIGPLYYGTPKVFMQKAVPS